MKETILPSKISEEKLTSPKFFDHFLEKRSWEPGWLVDFRKDSWMKFNQLPNITSKDDKWRFSPRARLSHSTFDKLSETNIGISLEYNELNGLFLNF